MDNVLEYAHVLNVLCLNHQSVNIRADALELVLVPGTNDDNLVEMLSEHYETIARCLPGVCDNCRMWSPIRVASFYGARPTYCHVCLKMALNLFETREWPEVDVPDYAPTA